MIKLNKIKTNEFLIGMLIITLFTFGYVLVHPPVIKTTLNVKITPNESVYCNTSKEGKVNCYVKK